MGCPMRLQPLPGLHLDRGFRIRDLVVELLSAGSVPLSIGEHAPYRVDGDEHPFRSIREAPETEAAIEFPSARKGLVSAIVDHVQDNQFDPDLAGGMPGAD